MPIAAPKCHRPRRSRLLRAGAVLAAAAALAACSSPSLPILQTSPKVTGTGKHYSYSAAHVPRSQWPNPCSLLTRSAGEAALGTSINLRRFQSSCYYQPGSAMYPTLTITLMAVGTASDTAFAATSRSNAGLNRTSISGIGSEAYLHPVRHLPATALEVLTRNAYFSVTEQSPVGLKLAAGEARTLVVSVGRVVARSFEG